MAAAYVDAELQSEFGKIPPCFLPLGNRRLFQHQVKLIPNGVQGYISVPESYTVSEIDKLWLTEQKIELIKTPDGLTLGASLVAAVNLSGKGLDKPLHILFGDTLFKELPVGEDIICTSGTNDTYNWAVLTNDEVDWIQEELSKLENQPKSIVSGYFKFSNTKELIKAVTQSGWDLIGGLNKYNQVIGLTPIYEKNWYDFGHVKNYFRSKASFTTERAFNELKITDTYVQKSSTKNSKIEAEALWFENLPSNLRAYTPQFLGMMKDGRKVSYKLEYLYQTALNELYVFSDLPIRAWDKILKSCLNFLSECNIHKAPESLAINHVDELFVNKTRERLKEYIEINGISLEQEWIFNSQYSYSIKEVLEVSEKSLPKKSEKYLSILHGDFCFSNILYDFRTNRIKTIDPRGLTLNGEFSNYGDLRYDLAKLSHSIVGMYDWIVAGYCMVEIKGNSINFDIAETPETKAIQQLFLRLVEEKFAITAKELIAMQIQLFFSMLPLHSDNKSRQDALFANAFKLFTLMGRIDK